MLADMCLLDIGKHVELMLGGLWTCRVCSQVQRNWCVEAGAPSRISGGQKKLVNLGMEAVDEPR